ncbi:hypothetical protein FJTKL_15203 [Diaporthe vaccinii]|uniref:Rhodopsin domain-containing protein n=1 Tax=Diaporthe vaccinii TaxID=105482 RepID=A0ABR4E5Y0_9PEZI
MPLQVFVASASTSFGLMTRYGGGRHVIFITSKKGLQIYGILQLTTTVCNIITDFIILFLPIRQVQRLHASKEKKRWIYFSSAMSGSACVVSVIRLVFALQVGSLDGSWDAVPAAWASEAEICAGFLVVSIPTYRPIYRKAVYGSDDALDVRTGKCYQLELGSYESNNHASQGASFGTAFTLTCAVGRQCH